ncbi:protein ANTI-SILENCING 1 isoform X1 [Senna tora]|uniref:Protein ANTI-SILENCING 1 isoform X1 n=1 Tax=Senna tora TaxID=362788 RepID=A0A834WER6_9FABA|nr:protein ANTI-SILENCING 1 isoform X1 [Senna tora]
MISNPISRLKIVIKKRTGRSSMPNNQAEDKAEMTMEALASFLNLTSSTRYKHDPWEERLRRAQELGSLILLNNLDPSYTPYEVEDLVRHALNERVEARMIEWSPTFNPHYGRAFVIFKTKDAAESAISRLLLDYRSSIPCSKRDYYLCIQYFISDLYPLEYYPIFISINLHCFIVLRFGVHHSSSDIIWFYLCKSHFSFIFSLVVWHTRTISPLLDHNLRL